MMTEPTIDFAKMDGLAPGIVQDARTGRVLMLGFLNEESTVREVIPKLKAAKATGIVEYPLNKVVL
jgi:phosphoribosyl-AMP cyclohydrolase